MKGRKRKSKEIYIENKEEKERKSLEKEMKEN